VLLFLCAISGNFGTRHLKLLDQLKEWPQRQLFVVSLLMLYLETMLIRVSMSEVRVLGYMPAALMACAYFGSALGVYNSRSGEGRLRLTRCVAYLALFIWLVGILRLTPLAQVGLVPDATTYFNSLQFFGSSLGYELTGTLVVALVLQLTLMITSELGFLFGDLFTLKPVMRAYGLTLAGAIAAFALFGLASVLWLPPAAWLAIFLAVAWRTWKPSRREVWLGAFALIGALSLSFSPESLLRARFPIGLGLFEIWSPYYQVQARPLERHGQLLALDLWLNGASSQTALSRSLSVEDRAFVESELGGSSISGDSRDFYNIPYHLAANPRRVLVLGAGTGNDVAAALAHGAQHVDAVEIDPVIAFLGREHPDKPYRSPRVQLHNMDARYFVSQPGIESYDLILLSKLDSQVATSSFGAGRQSDFPLTVEGLRLLKRLIAPGGQLVVAMHAAREWCVMRMVRNLREVFSMIDGAAIAEGGQYLVTTNEHPRDLQPALASAPGVITAVDTLWLNESCTEMEPTTDEWPFFFASTRIIPVAYLWCMYVLVAVLALNLWPYLERWLARLSNPMLAIFSWGGLEFFAFGVVLVLLESWAISMLSTSLGAIALVSGLAVLAHFKLSLIGSWLTGKRFPIPAAAVWAALLFCLLANYLLLPQPIWQSHPSSASTSSLLSVLGSEGLLVIVPIFLNGLLFCLALNRSEKPVQHMAVTVAGMTAGVILTNFAFIMGLRSVLVLAGIFYALACLAPHVAARRAGATTQGAV